MSQNITYFFVVQPGNMSFRARFLAASLRKFAPEGSKIHAFIPTRDAGLHADTRACLAHFDVETRDFEPRIWPEYDYPIGNKIDVCLQGFDTDFAVFMDTDILVTRAFDPAALMQADLSALPIKGSHVFQSKSGEKYNQIVLELLKTKEIDLSPSLARAFQKMPQSMNAIIPLFNSGVVAFRTNKGIAERWDDFTRGILDHPLAGERMKRPFADQASLGILAYENKSSFQPLSGEWNSGPRTKFSATTFLHYFRLSNLLKNPDSLGYLIGLHQEFASQGLNLLGEISVKDLENLT